MSENSVADIGKPDSDTPEEEPKFTLTGFLAFFGIITGIVLICIICVIAKRCMPVREEEPTIGRTITSDSVVNKRMLASIETEQKEIDLLEKAIAGRPSALIELKIYDRDVGRDRLDDDLEIQ